MPFLQPAKTTLAPAGSPVSTPRAEAEQQAMRSFMSSMPGGSIDFSRTEGGGGRPSSALAGGGATGKKTTDALSMMNFSAADQDQSNVSAIQTYESTSTKLHHQSTLAWQNRTAKPGGHTSTTQIGGNSNLHQSRSGHHRSPLRGNSSRTVGNITKRSSSALGGHSTSRALDQSMHTADAACCGYRNLAEHQSHVKKCKGLFVTFCASSVEQQLANAQRELVAEQLSRESDYDRYRNELAALVHENDRLKRSHAEMTEKVAGWDNANAKSLSDINVLKVEYEHRWREELEENGRLRTTASDAVKESERLKTEDGGNRYRIQELEAEVLNLKDVVKRSEAQSAGNASRAQLLFDETELLSKKAKNYEQEIESLNETVRTKGSVIVGLERELGKASEKLSSISFFRDTFAGKKKAAVGLQRTLSNSGGPESSLMGSASTKERLRQRYFGRLGRAEG